MRRCPNCGNRHAFFNGWYRRVPRCRVCGLDWQRNRIGFILGAVAMNVLLTFGALLVVMVVGVVATYPEVSTWPLIGLTAAVALIVGVGGYPISYTLWLAVDIAMNPLDAGEIADAAAHAA